MKSIKNILGIIILLLLGLVSCKDDYSVDLSNRKFVRINKQTVSLTIGEKFILKAKVDTLGSASKTFNWSIVDGSVASIEAKDDKTAVVTALGEGSTVIKIESTDGELKYFSDLIVAKDRIIKVLSIGNSLAEDAVENYLYHLSASAGKKIIIGNLYLNESSLEQHWTNASENKNSYQFRLIGTDGGKNTQNDKTIAEVIASENWDFISFEEFLPLSGKLEGYQNNLPKLVGYAKALTTNPDVKFLLHQPWAYAGSSTQEGFSNYDRDQMKMYNAIVDAVSTAKDLANIDLIVPSGTAIQNGRTTYVGDPNYLGDLFVKENGYRLSEAIGKFTAAATWYETIFGDNVLDNPLEADPFSTYEINLVKTAAHSAVVKPNEVTNLTAYRYPEGFVLNTYILNHPIYIDFGPIFSGIPFNNYGRPTDPKLTDLKDQNGESTKFEIGVKDPFTGTLERGLNNSLGFPRTASEDMFFSDGNNENFRVSSFALSNFNPDLKYTFVFYGAINDSQTETQFRVIGKNEDVANLVNDSNMDRVAIVSGISPTDYGTLIIQMTKGPNNTHWAGFFGVNVMIITPDGYKLPGMN
jgi:Bacterial Ig-like domain (group 2).